MEIELWPITRPRPYPDNPRRNEAAVDKVAALIGEFGWKQPLVVDSDGVIVVGHTRLLAAQKLGLAEVPVLVARDLTPAQVKAYRLADNRSNEDAEWDRDLLALELRGLEDLGFDLSLTAFDADEITGLKALQDTVRAGLADDDSVPEVDSACVSVRGDLWMLGAHRLLVGDATQIDDVNRLMDGGLADLVVTDPPYNVAYVGKTKDALVIKNDSMADGEFFRFLCDACVGLLTVCAPGACIYVFHSDLEGANFRRALTESGWKLSQCCIWVKQTIVMGRQDYQSQHEPILYGWKPTQAHRWYSDRKQSTVWRFDRPSRNAEHPTMKPVELIEYPLLNSSKPGDLVLDVFGGSGSTLIACEKQGRRARLIELDPKYADVIVRRWQQFTGREARREDGATFDSVAAACPRAA